MINQTILNYISSDIGIGFIAVLIVSLTSFVGALIFILSRDRINAFLPYLVSISAGALLGDAMLHLLPEAFETASSGIWVGVSILIGFFLFLLLEHGLHWHHSHGEDEESHEHGTHIGGLITVADSVHNLLDGLIVALGFMISVPVGVATTFAVILHEIPQEIGDIGLLLYAGWSKKKALLFNFVSACFAFIGYGLVVFVSGFDFVLTQYMPYLLGAAAGGFVYIAGADLIPELRKNHRGDFAKHISVIIIGVFAMALLLLLE